MEEKNGIRDSGASSHDIVLGCRLLLEEGLLFNIIYNKNSPTSAGSEMNCRSEHKCSKEFYK